MIALAVWAWIVGLIGLVGAVLLQLRPGGGPAPDRVAGTAPGVERAFALFFRREYLVLAIILVVAGGLLGWATSILTGVAFLSGGVLSALAGAGALHAAWRGVARVSTAAGEAGERPVAVAFSAGSVSGLAVISLALLGLGVWYMARGAGAITDADFQAFAATIAGFALGAACAGLLARVTGAVHAGGRAFAAGPVAAGAGAEPVRPTLADGAAGLLADVGGTAGDIFGSLAASVIGSMALGAGVPQYASSRQPAMALPGLLLAAVVVAALFGAGVERALRRRVGPARLRLVALLTTVLFLVLAYGIVRALGFQIVDPTGARAFRPDAPFIAVLFGVVAALVAGIPGGMAFRREARAEGAAIERPALALGAAVVPVVAVAIAGWASYFLAGLYGLAIAAIGLNATLAANYAHTALAPILGGGAALAGGAGGPETGAEGARDVVGRMDAMSRSMLVAGAALAALATLSGYASLVGLPEGTLDLLDAPVILGLLVGVAVPYAFGASVMGSMRRAAGAGAESGGSRGRPAGDVVAVMGRATGAALRGAIVPALLAIALPILVGLLSLTMLGGLVGGTILTAFALAAAMTRGDRVMAATAPTLNALAKVVPLVALVLCGWLAVVHGVGASATSLGEGAHRLLALLGR